MGYGRVPWQQVKLYCPECGRSRTVRTKLGNRVRRSCRYCGGRMQVVELQPVGSGRGPRKEGHLWRGCRERS